MTRETAHLTAMATMLMQCRDTFREYERNHRAKSPPDHTKAIRNGNLADEIGSLLRIVDGDDTGGTYYLMKLPQRVSFDDPQPDLTQPVPLIVRRVQDGEEPNLWAAGDVVLQDEYWARKHLRMALPEYRAYCDAKYFLGRKIAPEDYAGPVHDDSDTYADSVEELINDHDFEGAWCCTADEVPFAIDFEGFIEGHIADEHHEDAMGDLVDYPAISQAVTAWAEKQTLRSYQPSNLIVVIDQTRFDAERAKAQVIVEAWEAGEAA